MTELPASVAAFRARHRAHDIGPRYRGWLHFATTTLGSAAVIAFCAWRVVEPTVIELAMIPVIFLFANLVEYFGHRGPMHHRSARLAILFERHAQQSHKCGRHRILSSLQRHIDECARGLLILRGWSRVVSAKECNRDNRCDEQDSAQQSEWHYATSSETDRPAATGILSIWHGYE